MMKNAQYIAPPVLRYLGKSERKIHQPNLFLLWSIFAGKYSLVPIINIWIKKCSDFVTWCHSILQYGKPYIQALVRHIACDVKCVYLKRFWLCTFILKLLLQNGKYLRLVQKLPKGSSMTLSWTCKMCFCKLWHVLENFFTLVYFIHFVIIPFSIFRFDVQNHCFLKMQYVRWHPCHVLICKRDNSLHGCKKCWVFVTF